MSASDLSAGSALRASRPSVEAAPSTPSTGPSAPSGFRDLLSCMVSASNRSTVPSAISVADHRPTWGKEMSRVVGTPDEKSDGGDSDLPGLLGSQSDSSAGAEDQSSVVQLPDAPPSLDATSMAMRESAMSISTLLGETPPPPTARAGMCLYQASPGGQEAMAVQQTSTGDASILKEMPGDSRARSAAMLQGAPEPDAFALSRTRTAGATSPKDATRDMRAVISDGAPSGQLVSILAQETHIAPAALPRLVQGVRDGANHAVASDGSTAPGQSAEQVDAELPPARAVLWGDPGGTPNAVVEANSSGRAVNNSTFGTARIPPRGSVPILSPSQPTAEASVTPVAVDRRPRGTSYQPIARDAKSAVEQGGNRNAEVELGSSAPPADRHVADMLNESLRASAAAPLPSQPMADRIATVTPAAADGGSQGRSDTDLELGGPTPPAEHSLSVIANDTPRTLGTPGLPTHQVAGQIVAAALAVQREEAQPIDTVAAKPLASSVVKILHLELQPEDLGTITIRMSLKQDALDIRVEASRYDTACMLQRDQDSLAKILTSAGYRIDGMTVVTAATDGAAISDGRSQAFLSSSTPQHGGASQQDSRSSGGRSNAESSPRSSPGKQNDDNDKSRTARGTGGDLYV
jgi:chemotaxis protein MotD